MCRSISIQRRFLPPFEIVAPFEHLVHFRHWAGVIVVALRAQDEERQWHMNDQQGQKDQDNYGKRPPMQKEQPVKCE
jgi:hypothetical protein